MKSFNLPTIPIFSRLPGRRRLQHGFLLMLVSAFQARAQPVWLFCWGLWELTSLADVEPGARTPGAQPRPEAGGLVHGHICVHLWHQTWLEVVDTGCPSVRQAM